MASAPSVLDRIRAMQDGAGTTPSYAVAYAEILDGGKRSHWIWYVWPTLKGVRSTMRPELELLSLDQACAYLRDAVLCGRLVEITAAASTKLREGVTAAALFGPQHAYDAPKFHEACTLFLIAAEKAGMPDVASVFQAGLEAIAGGVRNARVLECIREHSSGA